MSTLRRFILKLKAEHYARMADYYSSKLTQQFCIRMKMREYDHKYYDTLRELGYVKMADVVQDWEKEIEII